MSFVFLEFVRQQRLVAESPVVEPVESGYPVAVFEFAVALKIVLTSGEVPHKVAPVHEVALIGEEETDVFKLCWHLNGNVLAASVVHLLVAFYTSHPTLVGSGMRRAVHTREEHVLSILVVVFCADDEVRVFLFFRRFLLALINGSAFLSHWSAHVALFTESHLRGVCLSVEKRT